MDTSNYLRFTGTVFLACSAVLFATFQCFIVNPAFKKLHDGGFDELYGPVSFFRIPVYLTIAVIMTMGIIMFLAGD